jgi:hypothetical protein
VRLTEEMALVWLVECKTCVQRFAVQRRESVPGKSTDVLALNRDVGSFECPHCHESHRYSTDDFVPSEGSID